MKSLANKRRLLAVLIGAALLMSFASPVMAASVEANVKTDSSLYEGPSKTSKAIASMKKGDTVVVIEQASADWVRVIASKKEGFMQISSLNLSGALISNAGSKAGASTAAHDAESGITLKDTRLKERPSATAKSLGNIKKGETVSVIDTANASWYQVSYDNKEGYVPKSDIQLGKVVTSTADTASTAPAVTVRAADANASKIEKAKKKNADTVGWITVPNTNVDEPILYRSNFYYATHNIDKKKSYEGVYPHTNKLTKNVVIYGHNLRKSGTVFHQLHHLQEAALGYSTCQNSSCKRSLSSSLKNWYQSKDSRTFNVSIFGTYKWEVFAMYEVSKKEPIKTLRNNWNTSPSNMESWIKGQMDRSELDFGVSVSADDQIMTLITCGTNYDSSTANSRLFVFLKCVD